MCCEYEFAIVKVQDMANMLVITLAVAADFFPLKC